MKLKKKLAAAAVSGMMLATCLSSAAPVVQTSLSAAAADDNNDDWLHAEGSKLYDANGNQVWLTGANWFGFNCTENCAHGLYATDIDAFLKTVGDHGINLIRMPISTELLVSWMRGTPDPVSSVNAGYEPPTDQAFNFAYRPIICRPRLYEENVHKERPQGAVPQKSKGQKDALLLIYDYAFL